MTAIMSYYFLSQRYERDYVIFINVENDFKHTSFDVVHATHFSYQLDKIWKWGAAHLTSLQLKSQYVSFKSEWAAINITLKLSSPTLNVIIWIEWAWLHTTIVLINHNRQIMFII